MRVPQIFSHKPLWQGGIFLSLLLPLLASAGYAGGPYVVWVNFDHPSSKENTNKIIAEFAISKSVNCDGNWKVGDSLLYMKKRPPLIDNELVESVFLKNDKPSKKRLNYALKNYKDIELQHLEGLDGIIVYTSVNDTKKMMSLTTGKRKIQSVTLASHGRPPAKADIEDAFCALLPPITRLP